VDHVCVLNTVTAVPNRIHSVRPAIVAGCRLCSHEIATPAPLRQEAGLSGSGLPALPTMTERPSSSRVASFRLGSAPEVIGPLHARGRNDRRSVLAIALLSTRNVRKILSGGSLGFWCRPRPLSLSYMRRLTNRPSARLRASLFGLPDRFLLVIFQKDDTPVSEQISGNIEICYWLSISRVVLKAHLERPHQVGCLFRGLLGEFSMIRAPSASPQARPPSGFGTQVGR
jgi:hypothetical protein